MLSLSRTTGYAILALACVAAHGGKPILVSHIARMTRIRRPYLAKTIHTLAQRGLLQTKRGYRGGVTLSRPARRITVFQIAEAMEGEGFLDRCLLGLEECLDLRACPTHAIWKLTKRRLERELKRLTLAEVAEFESGFLSWRPRRAAASPGRKR